VPESESRTAAGKSALPGGLRVNILLLGLTSFLTDVSSEMVYPLLPFFLTALGAGPGMLGLIEGIGESVASLLKVFSGYLSDRLASRKALTIAGYAASAAGKAALVIASGWGLVLAGRIVDRLGKGIRTAPRDALVADSAAADERGRAFGLHRAMDTAGAVVGIGLAYHFLTREPGHYAHVFLWSLAPAAAGVALLFAVREVERSAPTAARPSLRWRALPPRLRGFLGVTALFTLGNSSNAFLLLRAKSVGFTAGGAILLYLLYNVVFALSAYPAGRLSDWVGRKRMLVAGYVCYGLVYLGLARVTGAEPLWFVVSLFAAYGLYSAATEGVEKALVSDLAPGDVRATAIGWHGALLGLGLFPASFIAGQLWDLLGPAAAFYLGAATALLAAVALLAVL
jgi:MFS family permease